MRATACCAVQKHQRQAVGVHGDLVMHRGVVAVQGLSAEFDRFVVHVHKVVRRFALCYGRTGVVFAFTGNYRTAHGKCALLFNG